MLKIIQSSSKKISIHFTQVQIISKVKINLIYVVNSNSLIILFLPHRIVFEKPKPGDIVAVELDVKLREIVSAEYFRATVIDFVDIGSMNPQVRVKLIDEGLVDIVSVSNIE